MIEVKFNPKKHTLSVEGHAGYAEKGKDIVCAAVSILLYTLSYSLAGMEELIEDSDIQLEEGKSYIACKPKKGYRQNVDLIFWTCLNGFELLSENYPEHVSYYVE